MKAAYSLKRPIQDTRLVEVTLTMTVQDMQRLDDFLGRSRVREPSRERAAHDLHKAFKAILRDINDRDAEKLVTVYPTKIEQRPVRGGMLLEDTPAPKVDEQSVVGNADDLAINIPNLETRDPAPVIDDRAFANSFDDPLVNPPQSKAKPAVTEPPGGMPDGWKEATIPTDMRGKFHGPGRKEGE